MRRRQLEILQTTERNLLSVASTCLRCSQYQNLNSEIMCKQVLVTGASGFIASRLVSDLIASGENVLGFLRDPKKVTPLAIKSDQSRRPESKKPARELQISLQSR